MRTNLRVFRVRMHMTQGQMAESIGYKRQHYAAIESGKLEGKHKFWNDLRRVYSLSADEVWTLMQNDR